MKVLALLLSLMLGVKNHGYIVAELYEGYEKNSDLYIAEFGGVYLPVVTDDFNTGDEITIVLDNGNFIALYGHR